VSAFFVNVGSFEHFVLSLAFRLLNTGIRELCGYLPYDMVPTGLVSDYLCRMITPQMKQDVLNYLVNKNEDLYLQPDLEELVPELKMTAKVCQVILMQMENRGYIELHGMMGYNYIINLNADIFDFHRHGGYIIEEQLIGMEFDKLWLEIDKLTKSPTVENASKVLAGMGVIKGIWSVFGSK
jgi:hypothetical protein